MKSIKKALLAAALLGAAMMARPAMAGAVPNIVRSSASTTGWTPLASQTNGIYLQWCYASAGNNAGNQGAKFYLMDGSLSSGTTFFDISLTSGTSMSAPVDFSHMGAGLGYTQGLPAGLKLSGAFSIMSDVTSGLDWIECQYTYGRGN